MHLIELLCRTHNLGRQQLADQLGITRQTLYVWERNDPLPPRAQSMLDKWQEERPISSVVEVLRTYPSTHKVSTAYALARLLTRLAPYAVSSDPDSFVAAIDTILRR